MKYTQPFLVSVITVAIMQIVYYSPAMIIPQLIAGFAIFFVLLNDRFKSWRSIIVPVLYFGLLIYAVAFTVLYFVPPDSYLNYYLIPELHDSLFDFIVTTFTFSLYFSVPCIILYYYAYRKSREYTPNLQNVVAGFSLRLALVSGTFLTAMAIATKEEINEKLFILIAGWILAIIIMGAILATTAEYLIVKPDTTMRFMFRSLIGLLLLASLVIVHIKIINRGCTKGDYGCFAQRAMLLYKPSLCDHLEENRELCVGLFDQCQAHRRVPSKNEPPKNFDCPVQDNRVEELLNGM